MNLDLQLTMKQPTNERLDEFVLICVNSLGIGMARKQDKRPTGATEGGGTNGSISVDLRTVSSPCSDALGGTRTGVGRNDHNHPTPQDWIFDTPVTFRKRFVQ